MCKLFKYFNLVFIFSRKENSMNKFAKSKFLDRTSYAREQSYKRTQLRY